MLSVLFLSDHVIDNQNAEARDRIHSVMAIEDQEEIINFCKNNKVDIILMETDSIKESKFNELINHMRKECDHTKLVYISDDLNSILNKVSISKTDSMLSKNISYSELVSSLCFIKNDYRIFPTAKVIKMRNYEKLRDLTARELEVLDGLCKAYTRAEISEMLNISENTLKTHIQNILNKTGYKNVLKLALDLVVKDELDGEE